MNHYKSWSGLNKQLCELLCDPLYQRINYFLTGYSDVHNSYRRASILLDGKELVSFSWINMCKQEWDISTQWKETSDCDETDLRSKWEQEGTLSDRDFLQAATDFLQMPIADALESDNYIIRIFAIMDRRVGGRTITRIQESKEYNTYPEWVWQFYQLRFHVEAKLPQA